MKILHCSDLHHSHDAIKWIDANKSKFDVICLTGDFLDDREGQEVTTRDQVEFFKEWFNKFEMPLFVCSGNHDFYNGSLNWLAVDNNFFGDGTIVEIQGVTFGCIPYESEDFETYAECDIVLYHLPPSESSCAIESGENFGCLQIRTALKQSLKNVKYLLCGHVHKPKKHAIRLGNTIVSNPGGIHKDNTASYAVITVT